MDLSYSSEQLRLFVPLLVVLDSVRHSVPYYVLSTYTKGWFLIIYTSHSCSTLSPLHSMCDGVIQNPHPTLRTKRNVSINK